MVSIFLVEDDRAIAKNLALLLRAEGFTVTNASTREEAFLERMEWLDELWFEDADDFFAHIFGASHEDLPDNPDGWRHKDWEQWVRAWLNMLLNTKQTPARDT